MNTYKNTGRFNILVWVEGKVREVVGGEVFQTKDLLNHPYLTLIEDDKKISVKPKGKRLNKVDKEKDSKCPTNSKTE